MNTKVELQQKDRTVLEFIEDSYKTTLFTPPRSEVSKAVEIKSAGTLAAVFERLEAGGYIFYNATRQQYLPTRWRELVGADRLPPDLEKKVRGQIRKEVTEEIQEEQREKVRNRVRKYRNQRRTEGVNMKE